MGDMSFFLLIVATFAILMVMVWLVGEWRRQKQFRRLGQQLGLAYTRRDPQIPGRYGFLRSLREGHGPAAKNVLSGRYEGRSVCVFDCCLYVGRFFTVSRDFTYLVVEHGGDFPEVHICPRDLDSRLAHLFGYGGIDFESVEFSDAFCVRSPDRKFAYALCHPRMMAHLLQCRDAIVEVERGCIGMHVPQGTHGLLASEQIPRRLKALVEIRSLLPTYLFADYAKERP